MDAVASPNWRVSRPGTSTSPYSAHPLRRFSFGLVIFFASVFADLIGIWIHGVCFSATLRKLRELDAKPRKKGVALFMTLMDNALDESRYIVRLLLAFCIWLKDRQAAWIDPQLKHLYGPTAVRLICFSFVERVIDSYQLGLCATLLRPSANTATRTTSCGDWRRTRS